MGSEARKIDKKQATYQDIIDLPEHITGQLIAGELITSPRPRVSHAHTSSNLGIEIGGQFRRSSNGSPGGWWFLDEPELHFGDDVLVPDMAGWKKEKMPVLPNEAYITVAPNWVCEVLSKSTARIDRIKKLPVYAREKVDHVWLVDPENQTLEVYARQNEQWLLLGSYGGDARVRAVPFDAIELDLSSIWLPSVP